MIPVIPTLLRKWSSFLLLRVTEAEWGPWLGVFSRAYLKCSKSNLLGSCLKTYGQLVHKAALTAHQCLCRAVLLPKPWLSVLQCQT